MTKQTEYQRKLYAERKEKNLCLWCGKELDREGSICQSCAEKSKQRSKVRRDYFLKIGLCPYCGKRKVDKPYKSCPVCRDNANERLKARYTDQQREYQRMYAKAKRLKRAEQGLCTSCGQNPADPGYKTCSDCRRKARTFNRIYKTKYQLSDRDVWKMQGVCIRCGREDVHEGTSLCEKCYAESIAALEKGRKTIQEKKEKKRAEQEIIELEKERKLKETFKPRTLWQKREDQKGSKN